LEAEEEAREAIVRNYTVQDLGGQLYIALPKKWAESSSVEKGDKLTVTANKDVRIVSPKDRDKEELYRKISEFVDEPIEKVRRTIEEMEEESD